MTWLLERYTYYRLWISAWLKYRRAVKDMRAGRFFWTCYRYHGGGVLKTPTAMTEDDATRWLARVIKGDVAYIDRDHHFLFYRPRD